MSKEELIHQVLNEKQIDLYNFWAIKLLKEYPEYRQKVLKYWIKTNSKLIFVDILNSEICINEKSIITNCYSFYFTSSSHPEEKGFLNWILREEIKQTNKQINNKNKTKK
jgi:hypothetical protein